MGKTKVKQKNNSVWDIEPIRIPPRFEFNFDLFKDEKPKKRRKS